MKAGPVSVLTTSFSGAAEEHDTSEEAVTLFFALEQRDDGLLRVVVPRASRTTRVTIGEVLGDTECLHSHSRAVLAQRPTFRGRRS